MYLLYWRKKYLLILFILKHRWILKQNHKKQNQSLPHTSKSPKNPKNEHTLIECSLWTQISFRIALKSSSVKFSRFSSVLMMFLILMMVFLMVCLSLNKKLLASCILWLSNKLVPTWRMRSRRPMGLPFDTIKLITATADIAAGLSNAYFFPTIFLTCVVWSHACGTCVDAASVFKTLHRGGFVYFQTRCWS